MQQPVGQMWNGGHWFQMGGPGTTGPPLAMALCKPCFCSANFGTDIVF